MSMSEVACADVPTPVHARLALPTEPPAIRYRRLSVRLDTERGSVEAVSECDAATLEVAGVFLVDGVEYVTRDLLLIIQEITDLARGGLPQRPSQFLGSGVDGKA